MFSDFFLSYLFIGRANAPPIVRYNPADESIMNFNYAGGSAQSISLDLFNNVIYWANFVGSNHNIMKTMLNKETIGLNISYPGEIDLTSDILNLYVLDKDNKRIDKYLKTSLEKQGNITHDVKIHDLILAYGEFLFHTSFYINHNIMTLFLLLNLCTGKKCKHHSND